MTSLLVDAGNTRLKYAKLNASGEIIARQAIAYGERPAIEVLVELLDAFPRLECLTLVHVLNTLFDTALQAICLEREIHLHIVRSPVSAYGVSVAYPNPAALGADRFVGLVAAYHQAHNQPCIVIDCGTAITVDALDMDGQHLGGVILPGLKLAADTLVARAQKRLSYSLQQPKLFASDTPQAIGGGCLYGTVGAIEGIVRRMQQRLATPACCILTGGDAEYLHRYLHGEYLLQPELLIQGLHCIAEWETCTSS